MRKELGTSKRFITWILALWLLPAVHGCQIMGPHEYAEWPRSYPLAQDLPLFTVEELVQDSISGVSINVTGVVQAVHQCPEDDACNIADGFIISSGYDFDRDNDVKIAIHASKPKQFVVGRRHVFSVVTSLDTLRSGWIVRRSNLLGYN